MLADDLGGCPGRVVWGGGWLSWGFWPWGLDNRWWGGFSCGGVAFNPVVKRPGQGVSGAYRYAPYGVLAVGEMGLTWRFGVRAGPGPGGAGVWGGGHDLGFLAVWAGLGVSGAGCPCAVVGVTLRRKWGQGWCSVASVSYRRGRDGFPGLFGSEGI